MSAAATLPDVPTSPDPNRAVSDKFPKVRFLLGIVHKLVAYGTNMITTLQEGTSAYQSTMAMIIFGTKDFALIIARIKCGLQRAAMLEVRLNQFVTRGRDLYVPSERPSTPRGPQVAPSADAAAPPGGDEVLALLPSVEEIAEQVRRRPLGIVICDICRDLGLAPSLMDPALWDELFVAVLEYGASINRLRWDCTKPVIGTAEECAAIARCEWPGTPAIAFVSDMASISGRPP